MTTAAEILNKAAAHLQDRAATYDQPEGERSMAATVAAFNAITGASLSTEQGWMFMAVLKAVRSQQGQFKADNYEDGAAYFALAGEVAAVDRMSRAEVSARLQEIAKPARAEELPEAPPLPSFMERADAFLGGKRLWGAGDDGWIEWGGGECPVDGGVSVELRFRNGTEFTHYCAELVDWAYTDDQTDVIAYRISKEQS